jgi:hypothetical protein
MLATLVLHWNPGFSFLQKTDDVLFGKRFFMSASCSENELY